MGCPLFPDGIPGDLFVLWFNVPAMESRMVAVQFIHRHRIDPAMDLRCYRYKKNDLPLSMDQWWMEERSHQLTQFVLVVKNK